MTNPDSKASRAKNFPARRSFWLGLAVIALAFIFAAVISWRKWPDLVVDFGIQLYIPWRISEGAVLYRDLFYFSGGPLSQYYNALLFKIFGGSFLTLIVSNMALTGATLVLIYRRFFTATDAWTATMIGLGITLVFAFNEYSVIGNYNYVTPYSHESLHGLLLSIFAIALLSDWIEKEKIRFAAAAGFCGGLVFLTKPDIFLALMAGTAAAFVIFCVTRKRIQFAVKSATAFFSASLLPPLFFFFYFLRAENWRESFRSGIFGWLPLFQTNVAKNPFYQWCMGFDEPFVRLRTMFGVFLAIVLVIAFYTFAFQRMERLKSKWLKSQWIILLALISPLLFFAARLNWRNCGAPLPLLCLCACILICRNHKKIPAKQEFVFPLLWSVFGLALLAKLGFFPRIRHYGFTLAMPAFISAIYLLFWLLPMLLEKKYGIERRFFRVTVGLVLIIGFANLLNTSQSFYSSKNLAVGRGSDRIFTFGPRRDTGEGIDVGEDFNAALAWIDENIPPTATLAVLPEGTTLNYLSRRVNPTPCLDWNPTMFTVFGQANMTAAFEKSPPDYIFIVEWRSDEFGVGYFGHYPGYGMDLMQWIEKNYQPLHLIGNEPLRNGLFGIKILKRIPPV